MGAKLDAILKDINKKYKEEIAYSGRLPLKLNKIPFTSATINHMLYGGLISGIMCEFYGAEGGGKTTSALDLIKNAQEKFKLDFEQGLTETERICCFIDSENTLDEDWAMVQGVDIDKLLFIRPQSQTAEQIFDMMKNIVETGECGLIVLDSIATLVSQQIYDESFEKKSYAGISTPLTRFCNEFVSKLKKYDCLCIMINQMRDDLKSMYGAQKTPGGHAFKHHCSVRMEFRKGDLVDADNKVIPKSSDLVSGNHVVVRLKKTKICKQDRNLTSYLLNYTTGIDYISDAIEVGLLTGSIVQGGAYYTLIDVETGEVVTLPSGKEKVQGKKALADLLATNKEMYLVVEKGLTYEH